MLIKFKNFLHRLQRLLTRTRRYKQLLDSVSAPVKGFGRNVWILSRPLYRYVRFDLKSVPKPQRPQALALHIRQWSPFSRTGWYLLWDEDDALVWAWDAERVEAAVLENKLAQNSINIVPETLLHQCQEQGTYLVSCMDGVEGQVWRHRSLISSRWWPKPPVIDEWVNFQRDAGSHPGSQVSKVPVARPLNLGEVPWGKSVAQDGAAVYGAKVEAWLVPFIALCLFATTMWYGAQWIKLRTANKTRATELETLNQQAAPIVTARSQALESLGRIKVLLALDPYPNLLVLLSKLAEVLPKDGPYLKEWEFLNGKLKILIASPNKLVTSDYIKLLQSTGFFNNIQAASTSDPYNLTLNMDILSQAEIKTPMESSEPIKQAASTPTR